MGTPAAAAFETYVRSQFPDGSYEPPVWAACVQAPAPCPHCAGEVVMTVVDDQGDRHVMQLTGKLSNALDPTRRRLHIEMDLHRCFTPEPGGGLLFAGTNEAGV